MVEQYNFRRGESADAPRLKDLFNEFFSPSAVGKLAETVFHHLPDMEPQNWFIAEKGAGLVAAFALVPWTLELEGIGLKVAEMAIVGTLEEHQGRGLMRRLNSDFDQALAEGGYDLAMIQGIPGFYGQFGYNYALPLENHINMPLHAIGETKAGYAVRRASNADIPFLLREDAAYRAAFSLSVHRDKAIWDYMLNASADTEYASEFWLLERGEQRFYFRVQQEGFGAGLIISEVSEDISAEGMGALLAFGKKKAIERDKPYIRFNLSNDSRPGKLVCSYGAEAGDLYTWQIKIPDKKRLLQKATPLLEKRLAASSFAGLSARLRLDFFREKIDLIWQDGKLIGIETGSGDAEHSFCINANLFPALCLGHRSWQELRHVQPDIFPAGGLGGVSRSALCQKAGVDSRAILSIVVCWNIDTCVRMYW
ncbi:MAG: GNAT family N-acetyltransferase [Candidatus Latescibacterota bacterium]